MARFKKIPQKIREGKIIYADGIIDNIVCLALQEIPDVALFSEPKYQNMRTPSIKVDLLKDGVHVEVEVKVHYMQTISDVAFKIQEAIRHNVEAMTDYHVANVNVMIKGVFFDERVPEQNTTTTQEIQQEG